VTRIKKDPVLAELGSRIRAAREDAGLTQEQAAESASVPYKRYQAIEHGRANVTVKTIARVARGLRLSVWDLVGQGAASRKSPSRARSRRG